MNYRLLFKQKEYMKFIISNAVSRLGDSIDAIAFTWLVYEITSAHGQEITKNVQAL